MGESYGKVTERPWFNRFSISGSGCRYVVLATIAALAFLIGGCRNEEPPPISQPSQQPEMQQEQLPLQAEGTGHQEVVNPFRFPLTGLESIDQVNDRPIMVMIENSPAARPQTGLEHADIVYEILAEYEVTRFAAIFQSEHADVIGPVRSIRPYYVEIGDGHHAIIVHAGWSQEAMNMMAERQLNHLDQVYGDQAFYWRTTDRKAPHNVYTSIEKIRQGAEARKFSSDWYGPAPLFSVMGNEIAAEAVQSVIIPYIRGYNVSYQYDAATNTYKRFMEGKPHLDKDSENQLSTTNIMIVEAEHRVVDSVGHRDVDLEESGNGYLLRDGKKVEITWEQKDGILQPFQDGRAVGLSPGKTWIQVVPIGSKISFE